MFLSGNNLYWASKVDGTLHRDAFAAGALSGDTIVSGPAVDGNDWRSRAMWVDSNGSANQPPTARVASTCANLTCSFDGTGSSDPDGTIASYAWNFGDGTTSTNAKPSHTYAAGGPYTVTLTVTDDKGATGTATKSVTVTAPNQPPNATISAVSCTGLTCAFDGSGSADADGSITSYAWTFGDGGTASGPKPSHTYGSASAYTVTLTVTDDKGATGTATTSVSPTAQQPAAVGFVGASSANSNQPTKTVTVPAATRAGDALLLLLSKNSTVTTSDPSGTGWVAVDSVTNGSMVTQVWKKVATASDASSTVSITQPGYGQADLELLAYTGTNTTDPIESYASAADSLTSASHTTPTASVTQTGSWAVSYWTDKSSSTTAWTAPASVTTRATSIGTGSGRMTALVADSGAAVSGSSYGGLTATTDQAAARAEAWTFVLAPR
jgi:PKD repeat protein